MTSVYMMYSYVDCESLRQVGRHSILDEVRRSRQQDVPGRISKIKELFLVVASLVLTPVSNSLTDPPKFKPVSSQFHNMMQSNET